MNKYRLRETTTNKPQQLNFDTKTTTFRRQNQLPQHNKMATRTNSQTRSVDTSVTRYTFHSLLVEVIGNYSFSEGTNRLIHNNLSVK